jgi:nitrogen fixation protein
MFPLASQEIPQSAAELAAAVEASLREHLRLPKRANVVEVGGAERFPKLGNVEINLNGAEIDVDDPPPRPRPSRKRQPGPSMKVLHVSAKPILWADSQFEFELSARDGEFEYARDQKSDELLLTIKRVRDGELSVRIRLEDLERALFEAADAAAGGHGVTVKDVRLKLSKLPRQANALAADVDVTARKFLTASIHISGMLTIDDDLNAVPSHLECSGEGMVGSLVCGLLKPHLRRIDGRRIPLQAIPVGSAKVRDVQIRLDEDALNLRARFG